MTRPAENPIVVYEQPNDYRLVLVPGDHGGACLHVQDCVVGVVTGKTHWKTDPEAGICLTRSEAVAVRDALTEFLGESA